MSRVPDDPVARGFENTVQSQRQLHDSERRAEMTAGPGNGGNDAFADLGGQGVELVVGQPAQLARAAQRGQDCQLRMLLSDHRTASWFGGYFVCAAVYRDLRRLPRRRPAAPKAGPTGC